MRATVIALACLLAGSCTTAYWSEDADREVEDVLAEKQVEFDDFRANGLVDPAKETAEARAREAPADLSWVPHEVGLEQSLEVATKLNRNYLSEKESLYLSALSLTGVRNQFSPVFAGSLSAVLNDTNTSFRVVTNRSGLSVSQILPTGGSATLSGDATAVDGENGNVFGSNLSASFTQPLLKDAGYETSHASLTQGERNVVYAIRDFELFREDFTIQITSQFYSLVRQRREIDNAEKNLVSREFLRNQSQAKFAVGLATEVDKLRSDREYLRAQNDLLQQREAYQLSLDRFKIQLGVPTSYDLDIVPQDPSFQEVRIDLARAVEAALHNRLDLLSARDRHEDVERDLRIAVNRFRPELDLTGSYSRIAAGAKSPRDLDFDAEAWSLGLSLTLPLERTSERNAVRQALISLKRSERGLTLAEDNVILDVRNSLRQLRRAETSIEIRRQEIDAARREAAAAEFRFERGEMDNRNLTDAQNAVLRSENALIADLVDYEVSRIQLKRDLGILFIDENGMWVER